MTLRFPKLFLWPVEVDRILVVPVAPETLMVAFAYVPATMPALVSIVIDAVPPAAAFADASAMALEFDLDTFCFLLLD